MTIKYVWHNFYWCFYSLYMMIIFFVKFLLVKVFIHNLKKHEIFLHYFVVHKRLQNCINVDISLYPIKKLSWCFDKSFNFAIMNNFANTIFKYASLNLYTFYESLKYIAILIISKKQLHHKSLRKKWQITPKLKINFKYLSFLLIISIFH